MQHVLYPAAVEVCVYVGGGGGWGMLFVVVEERKGWLTGSRKTFGVDGGIKPWGTVRRFGTEYK